MKLFRIYTEDKNELWIRELLSVGFDGFTVIKTTGAWKGTIEDSLLIEIYTDNAVLIKAMAEKIKCHNQQESVLVTETKCKVEFV